MLPTRREPGPGSRMMIASSGSAGGEGRGDGSEVAGDVPAGGRVAGGGVDGTAEGDPGPGKLHPARRNTLARTVSARAFCTAVSLLGGQCNRHPGILQYD